LIYPPNQPILYIVQICGLVLVAISVWSVLDPTRLYFFYQTIIIKAVPMIKPIPIINTVPTIKPVPKIKPVQIIKQVPIIKLGQKFMITEKWLN